jgi:NitT/TauT family transport system permease protein
MKNALPPLLAAIFGVVLWQAAIALFGIAPYLVPPPMAVVRAASENGAALFGACITTGSAAIVGFLLSAIVGVAIAVILSSSRAIERAFYPYALVLQTVPIVAIAPLLVLWFGVGMRAVTASAFIVSVFPVITNALTGIRSVDPALRDLFRLYGASRPAVLFRLELPHATLSIATGLKVASGLAVIGAIVGEFVAGFAEGRPGLGILVMTAYRQLRTDLMFAAVACSALLGLALFGTVTLLAWLSLRKWNAAA